MSLVSDLNDEFLALLQNSLAEPPVDDINMKEAMSFFVDIASQARLMYIHMRMISMQGPVQQGPQAFVPTGGQ